MDDLQLAQQFREKNSDLGTLFDTFSIRLEHDTDGMHMLLELQHSTTRDDLAANWSTIDAWKERVHQWQLDHEQAYRFPTLRTAQNQHRTQLLELLDRAAQGWSFLQEDSRLT